MSLRVGERKSYVGGGAWAPDRFNHAGQVLGESLRADKTQPLALQVGLGVELTTPPCENTHVTETLRNGFHVHAPCWEL